ncbi:hypothetical protein JS528_09490 [Bifidobacterium sp. MA2]|uniref:Uncharacterized protein n=1 Tax=Bifidobacterium santillanense TaxID=2809028 RepID=A0ABS5URN7_9BIFI|nr:hypothetical protein [Bifidobacterium santillanense]MBT1173567.1 hypothetical protein [Bifidobacterium santillanense]
MVASTALVVAVIVMIGVGALFLWREPTAAPYGWGVNGIAASDVDDANGPLRSGVDATIAAIVARTKGGGNVVEAFQQQGGMRFATRRVSAERAAAVLHARAAKHDTDEDIERTARHLAAACRLSERLGCAISPCLEAVGVNHRRESKANDLKRQAFAGPKATIKLLSAMPVLTIVAGELMGASSFHFLITTIPGWVCLALGAVWYGAGMLWTSRMLAAFGRDGDADENLPIALEMLCAALGQGSSIPSALIAVGMVLHRETDGEERRFGTGLLGRRRTGETGVRQPLAKGMRTAGEALTRGAGWREAWLGANATALADPDGGDDETGGEERRIGIAALHPSMAVVYDCLGEAWSHGASPTERLTLAAREYDREQLSRIEQEAAQLSVKLLLPSALCFLPAFVLIGIVPAIMSLLMG